MVKNPGNSQQQGTAGAVAVQIPPIRRTWGDLVQEGIATLARDWWEPEMGPDGRFVWGGAAAEVVMPTFPRGTRLELDLQPAQGAAPLEIVLNDTLVKEVEGMSGRQRFWLPEEALAAEGKNQLLFKRAQGYVPSNADLRPLAVQLFGVRTVGPGALWAGGIATEDERARSFVKASGLMDPEEFPEGPGVWTKPEAQLWLPVGPGSLTLTVWAPRPKAPVLELSARGKSLMTPMEIGPDPMSIELPISPAHIAKGGLDLDLRATPFCPAREGAGDDQRELGVVITHARFTPRAV